MLSTKNFLFAEPCLSQGRAGASAMLRLVYCTQKVTDSAKGEHFSPFSFGSANIASVLKRTRWEIPACRLMRFLTQWNGLVQLVMQCSPIDAQRQILPLSFNFTSHSELFAYCAI
jgi:hypothetical protein